MSIRENAAERRAHKNAQKDLRTAQKQVRKAIDFKDPKFLGEAAVAASRGPVGLALFGARKGLAVARDHREEQLDALQSRAESEAKSARKDRKSAEKALERSRKGPLRRFAPLWVLGLVGGAAAAGATAWFLRDGTPSTPASRSTAPTPKPAPAPEPADVAPGVGSDSAPTAVDEAVRDGKLDPSRVESTIAASDAQVKAEKKAAVEATGSDDKSSARAGAGTAGGADRAADEMPTSERTATDKAGAAHADGGDLVVETPDPDDIPDHKK